MRHVLVLMTLFVTAAAAQEPQGDADAKPPESEAEALIRRIDDAIYYPFQHGLVDFRFRWKAAGTGVFDALNDDVYIAYAWKKPGHIRVEYVNGEGERIEKLPEISKHPELVKIFKQIEGSVHVLAQQHLVGAPYAKIYRDYYKRVHQRVVNNKVEYELVLTPKSKKRWTQIVVKVIGGLPREITKTDEHGNTVRVFRRFEKRGDKHLPVGLRVEQNNQLVMDEEYVYVRIDGVYVLKELVRATAVGEKARETLRLERLQVNTGLPDTYFTEAASDGGDGGGSDEGDGDGDD